MGIQTSLDALRAAERIVDGMRLADELAFESTPRPRRPHDPRAHRRPCTTTTSSSAIAAVHALGTIVDDEASRAVARLLSDERPFVREHAAWVLGSGLPRADAVARLIGMTAGRRVRRHARAADARAVVRGRAGARRGRSGVRPARGDRARGAGPRRGDARASSGTPSRSGPCWPLAGDVGRGRRGARRGGRRARPAARRHARSSACSTAWRRATTTWRTSPGWRSSTSAPARRGGASPRRDGLSVAQLFLHADIDAGLSAAGAGDNGGIATLLVRLGDALVAGTAGRGPWTGCSPCRAGRWREAAADLGALRGSGHHYGRVPLRREPVPMAAAWSLRVSARRGIRRVLRAAGGVDLIHLRMADVGSLAAADVAQRARHPRRLHRRAGPARRHPVARPRGPPDAGRTSARSTRSEHFWFRARLVQRLAANAAHTVLFPRPALQRDMRELVGIDITAHPERHTIVPGGRRPRRRRPCRGRGARRTRAATSRRTRCAELRALVEALPSERRALPLIVSVGRLHRVKGMATLVAGLGAPAACATGRTCSSSVVTSTHPSADEREQLDLIDAIVPAAERAAAGLLLPGPPTERRGRPLGRGRAHRAARAQRAAGHLRVREPQGGVRHRAARGDGVRPASSWRPTAAVRPPTSTTASPAS